MEKETKTVTTIVKGRNGPVKNKRNNKSNRRRPEGRNRRARGGASVSTPFTHTTKGTAKIAIRGSDRLAKIPDIRGLGENSIGLATLISAESFQRLEKVASAYQRILFKKLSFRVVPMAPTNVSGGYVAAFVADPNDNVSNSSNALARLISQHGAKVTKAWESCTVNARNTHDLLYTSIPRNGDARLYSPGQFVLGIDSRITSPTNQAVPVSIYADWSVELMVPSLEEEEGQILELIANSSFYCRNGHPGLWYDQGSVQQDDPRGAIPGIQFDIIYELSSSFYCEFTTEGGNYWEVIMVNDKDHGITLAPIDPSSRKPVIEVAKNDEGKLWVFRAGTKLTPVRGEVMKGLEFLCRTPLSGPLGKSLKESPKSSLPLDPSSKILENSSKKFAKRSKDSASLDKVSTKLKEQLRLMESQLLSQDLSSSNDSIEVIQ